MGRTLVAVGVVAAAPFLWGLDAAVLSAPGGSPGSSGLPSPAVVSDPAATTPSTSSLGSALKPSSAQQLALVDHLRRKGAVFYGAWWCPACFKQKNLFGQQAGDTLPYVECEKTKDQRQRCATLGIGAYPTWVLGGQRLEGVQSLERLGQWSGFQP
ncbi:MAG: hypothetical protein RLZZ117_1017 [Cyanobacteriota bacterium]